MNLIEEVLNIPEIDILSIEDRNNELHIQCKSSLNFGYCPHCLEQVTEIKSYNERVIRDLSISGKRVYLHLKVKQFHCKLHHEYFYQNFTFVNSNSVFTTRYKEYIYACCKGVDIQYVAQREGIAWDTVNSIFKSYSQSAIQVANRLSKVRLLGIDEISLHKGHRDFCCVLIDMSTGHLIELLPQRTKEYLIGFFKGLGTEFCERIEVVSSDMWEGFTNLAGTVFPNAEVVVDRFHFFYPSTSN